jgi:NTP pyrophosphatase (non-canonical NTP hydrolase)
MPQNIDIELLKDLDRQASEGPWRARAGDVRNGWDHFDPSGVGFEVDGLPAPAVGRYRFGFGADARLVAEMRNQLPMIISRLESADFQGLTFDEYQHRAEGFADYPNRGSNFTYPALGLAGESGEVCEKIKKVIRDRGGEVDGATRQEIAKELGDVLWYVSQLALELGLSMAEIAQGNIDKLSSRQRRGKLHGDGDNR